MPKHNLIEYSDNYSNTSWSLWQYYRNEPSDNITNFESFNFKSEITNNTNNAGTSYIEIAVPLTYLSNFLLINRSQYVITGKRTHTIS